jgi:tetratricopeptide (TPR) repeat protein
MRATALLGLLACVLPLGPAAASDPTDCPRGKAGADCRAASQRLALAQTLARDGADVRAEAVLSELDPAAWSVAAPAHAALQLGRYWSTRGLVALRRDRPGEAARHLEKAARNETTPAETWALLARARYATEDWAGAVAALQTFEREGGRLVEQPMLFLLRGQAHWRLDQPEEAWATLERGRLAVPGTQAAEQMLRAQVLILVELGLFNAASARGRDWLGRPSATADDFVAVAEALRRSGNHPQAVKLLEEARLRFPDASADSRERVAVLLGRSYLDEDLPLAAALVFQEAAMRFPRLTVEAAELYRRAGRMARALWGNARVADITERTRQRFGLLLDAQRFEAASALAPRLSRLGLTGDDEIRYGLAYAAYRAGDMRRAERWLAGIEDAGVFERGVALRQAIAQCRESGGC